MQCSVLLQIQNQIRTRSMRGLQEAPTQIVKHLFARLDRGQRIFELTHLQEGCDSELQRTDIEYDVKESIIEMRAGI
jgi:hypothetical protein